MGTDDLIERLFLDRNAERIAVFDLGHLEVDVHLERVGEFDELIPLDAEFVKVEVR